MRGKRDQWLERIKGVEVEFRAARRAADFLRERSAADPTVLGEGVKVEHVRRMSDRLDGTYVIRLFAEFETGLRLFWPSVRASDPPSRTADLISSVAAMRRISDPIRDRTHEVREYRNALVHEREESVVAIPLDDCRGRLCQFFSYLPIDW